MSEAGRREWRFYIDDDTLWSIIQEDVRELLPLLEAMKNEVGS